MMQRFQNTLFINENDPTNAVIYDREWLRNAVSDSGLAIVDVKPPDIRGFQSLVTMAHKRTGELRRVPPGRGPHGSIPPPMLPSQDPGPSEE